MYTVIVVKAVNSELLHINPKGGRNRNDCLEFKNIVANFIVKKSVRSIRKKKFRLRVLGRSGLLLLIFTQPCDHGQTASV